MLDRRYISDRLNECDLTIYLRPGGQSILTNLCEIGFPGDLGQYVKNQFEWETSESHSLGNSGWDFARFPVHHTPETDPHGYVLTHKSGFRLCIAAILAHVMKSRAVLIHLMPFFWRWNADIGNFLTIIHPQTSHHSARGIREENFGNSIALLPERIGSGFLKPDLPTNVHQLEDGDYMLVNEDGSFEMRRG